jgi:predicted Ser/Thr protein kinase
MKRKLRMILLVVAVIIATHLLCSASAAVPGSRQRFAKWYYNNTLWLYGGSGMDEASTETGKLSDVWRYDPNTNIWTFIAGSKVKDQSGVGGGVGEFSPDYSPGGLTDMCAWVSGNRLYMFGGERLGTSLTSAVWKFSAETGQWAFMDGGESVTGSYVPSYQIGARKSCQCVLVGSDLLIVSGGFGFDSVTTGFLNDVWSYTMSSTNWKFVGGENTRDCLGTLNTYNESSTTEYPTCSMQIAGWYSGEQGLFFTAGRSSSGYISKVWSFIDTIPGSFTLLNGEGDLTPREGPASASNAANAWMFGGFGLSAFDGTTGLLADLLQWNGTAWQYIDGPKTKDTPGNYPTQPGTSSPSIFPGSRIGAAMWLDDIGDVWLFGGSGYGEADSGYLNDLWKYSATSNQWTWVSGSRNVFENGNYTNDPVAPPIAPISAPVSAPVEPPVSPPEDKPIGVVPTASPSSDQITTPVDDPLSTDAQIAIGVVVPAVAIGVGLLVLLLLLKRRKKQKAKKTTVTVPLNTNTGSNYQVINLNKGSGSGEGQGNYQGITGLATPSEPESAMVATMTTGADNRLIPYSSVTLEKEIGVGSFGKVFLGKLRTTKVAIKVANAHIPKDEFIREANFQLAIPPHPNIVQLLGVSVDGPQPLVVLEYCNEGSLDKVLFETKALSTPAEQIALADAIARGIDHLHQNNIVHRDLAVRNILLHRGEPKISDFGMSRKLKEASQVGKTATTIGPLRWMSPEALGQQLYSTKSDVWSFGLILCEIVTHEEPHQHEDLINVAIKIRDEAFTPAIPESCPPLLREIMEMCWKKDPNERPEMSTICAMLEGKATAL